MVRSGNTEIKLKFPLTEKFQQKKKLTIVIGRDKFSMDGNLKTFYSVFF